MTATQWPWACVTGHREHLIHPDARDWVRAELVRIAAKLRDEHSTVVGLCGLATGADTWWGEAVIETGLELWAYLPYPQQADKWNPQQQAAHARLLAAAAVTNTIGENPTSKAAAGRLLMARNRVMINDSDVIIAVRDPRIETGGTVAALDYNAGRRPVITVNITDRRTTINTGSRDA